jgi:hypothetical protein
VCFDLTGVGERSKASGGLSLEPEAIDDAVGQVGIARGEDGTHNEEGISDVKACAPSTVAWCPLSQQSAASTAARSPPWSNCLGGTGYVESPS